MRIIFITSETLKELSGSIVVVRVGEEVVAAEVTSYVSSSSKSFSKELLPYVIMGSFNSFSSLEEILTDFSLSPKTISSSCTTELAEILWLVLPDKNKSTAYTLEIANKNNE